MSLAAIETSSSLSLTTSRENLPEKKITKKIKQAADKPLKELKKRETCRAFCARIWAKFCAVIKKIFACLSKFFCFCCGKEDSSSDYGSEDYANDISLSDPLDEVEDFFLEIYKGNIPPDVDFKLKGLGLKKIRDPEKLEKNIKSREQRILQLQVSAQEMSSRLALKSLPAKFVPKGQINVGNSCYMNSVLQCLESCFAHDDEECIALISQDLSLLKGETLEGIEERLLCLWSPIPILDESKKLESSLKLLDSASHEITSLKMSLRDREDRILFKWTYLLLLQAKLKGTSEDISKAVKLHHHVCFELALHPEFKEGRFKQKDAAFYQECWNGALEVIDCPIAIQRVGEFEGKMICTDSQIQPQPLIQIAIQPAIDLCGLIGINFLEKKTAKDNEVCKFELPDKREVPLLAYNVVSEITSVLPKCLVFQFKRFLVKFEKGSFVRSKINEPLPIDLKRDLKPLDFSQYFQKGTCKENEALYELNSFVVHSGSLDIGHYVAYVKDHEKWYYISDSTVRQIDESKLPLKDAYMMYFKLRSK